VGGIDGRLRGGPAESKATAHRVEARGLEMGSGRSAFEGFGGRRGRLDACAFGDRFRQQERAQQGNQQSDQGQRAKRHHNLPHGNLAVFASMETRGLAASTANGRREMARRSTGSTK
jgi:hypothetical protein